MKNVKLQNLLLRNDDAKVLEALEYINKPLIIDHRIEDYNTSLEYWNEIRKNAKEYELLQQNKLRKNNILPALRLIANANLFFTRFDVFCQIQAASLIDVVKSNYDSMKLKDKILFTKTVDALILKFTQS